MKSSKEDSPRSKKRENKKKKVRKKRYREGKDESRNTLGNPAQRVG